MFEAWVGMALSHLVIFESNYSSPKYHYISSHMLCHHPFVVLKRNSTFLLSSTICDPTNSRSLFNLSQDKYDMVFARSCISESEPSSSCDFIFSDCNTVITLMSTQKPYHFLARFYQMLKLHLPFHHP